MFYTPLRYPGGKGKLANYVKTVLEHNKIDNCHYVEPYAGGSGVALELLFHEYASHIYINDYDKAIHAFWHSVLHHTDELTRLISNTRVTINNRNKQCYILKNQADFTKLELGFATFFLNRTNRSGILNAGVIGGKEQSGKWKLDVRYNKTNLIDRINKIALYKNRISLYRKDAIKLLAHLSPRLPKNTMIYLDPPYYIKGKGLYRNYYEHNDHVSVEKILRKMRKFHWLVSYDNVDEIKEIYKKYRQQEYSLTYTLQDKTQGSEVMIYGPKTDYPDDVLPYSSRLSLSA